MGRETAHVNMTKGGHIPHVRGTEEAQHFKCSGYSGKGSGNTGIVQNVSYLSRVAVD